MSIRIETIAGQQLSLPDAARQALDYCNSGWLDISSAICDRILAAASENADALLVKGIAAYKARNPAAAVPILSLALRRNPASPDTIHHLGIALLLSGELDRAELAFRSAMGARSDYAEAMTGLAEVLRAKGDADGAYALLERAVGLKNNYSPAYIAYSLMRFDRSLAPEANGTGGGSQGATAPGSAWPRSAIMAASPRP